MDAGRLLAVALGAALVNNLVLERLIGICPAIGAPLRLRSAAGLGLGVVLAMSIASVASVAVDRYVLAPLDLVYLRTITLVVLVVGSAMVSMRVLRNTRPWLCDATGRSLAGLVGNCAVLGVALLAVEKQYGLLEALVYAVSAGLGLLVVMLVLATLRARTEMGEVPESLKGLPIILITGGLMALAFLGFSGMGIE